MQHIFGSLPGILKEIDVSGEAVEPIVFAAWKRCVDGALAENVIPLRLENNRLIAAVPSETWRRNVADLRPALTAKLNAAAGSRVIKFIEFQVNAAAVREHRDRSKRADTAGRDALADQIAEDLSQVADSIADEELRKQFVNAAACSLARNKDA